MTDEQIDYLKELFSQGKIIFLKYDVAIPQMGSLTRFLPTCLKVIGFGIVDDEPVAYTNDGVGYHALYACDTNDFLVTSLCEITWPR